MTANISIAYINENHIKKINEIVEECRSKQIKIRWLKYTGEFKEEKISSFSVFGLNCKENLNLRGYYDDLEAMFYLSRINRESLVFKYDNDNLPNILFSADSGFEFLENSEKIIL